MLISGNCSAISRAVHELLEQEKGRGCPALSLVCSGTRILGATRGSMHRFGWAVAGLLMLLPLEAAAQTSPAPTAQPLLVNLRAQASALDAIIAIGLATHAPIGILPGQDTTALCKTRYTFNLTDMDATTALLAVAQRMQYSWYEQDGVMILRAPDLTPRQTELIERRIDFPAQSNEVTAVLRSHLAISLWLIDRDVEGYGASIGHAANDVRLSLPALKNVTAPEVANRVITTGSGGIWLSDMVPDRTDEINGYDIDIEMYQDKHLPDAFSYCRW